MNGGNIIVRLQDTCTHRVPGYLFIRRSFYQPPLSALCTCPERLFGVPFGGSPATLRRDESKDQTIVHTNSPLNAFCQIIQFCAPERSP